MYNVGVDETIKTIFTYFHFYSSSTHIYLGIYSFNLLLKTAHDQVSKKFWSDKHLYSLDYSLD